MSARRIPLNSNAAERDARGVIFLVTETIFAGHWLNMQKLFRRFIDFGNFMKVRLINTRLYPRFTPLVSKIGGNAKVFNRRQYYRFLLRMHYRRNPVGMVGYRALE